MANLDGAGAGFLVHPPGTLGWSWQAHQHDHAECLLQAERRTLDETNSAGLSPLGFWMLRLVNVGSTNEDL